MKAKISPEMQAIYDKFKTDSHCVYHIHFSGRGKTWIPCSPEWGYIGVTQLSLPGIKERYALEYKEYKEGNRKSRKLYTVWDDMGGMDRLTFKILHDDITSRVAYGIEEFYRPVRYDYSNNLIWNATPGGKS